MPFAEATEGGAQTTSLVYARMVHSDKPIPMFAKRKVVNTG